MRIPLLIAKGSIILLTGLGVGYWIGNGLADDVAKGKALTLREYTADFEHHKAELIGSGVPMPESVVLGVITALGVFGLYELLAAGLARLIVAIERRTNWPAPPELPP